LSGHSWFSLIIGLFSWSSSSVPTPVAVAQPKKRKRRELKKDKKDETEGKRRMKGRIKAAARQFPSQLDTLAGNEVQLNREHDALIRIQPSETEELSSGSDAFLQGPGGSSRNYNMGKRDLQGKPSMTKLPKWFFWISVLLESRFTELNKSGYVVLILCRS
jgi:hypothetical protein